MPANGLCQSAFRQRAQLWVCVSVCPWVGGCSYCPCFGPLCTSCLNMARLELLSDSFWSSSFPPHRSPSSFSSPKFFASFLCHPSIITPYFRVSPSTPPLLSLLSKPTSHLTPLPFFPFFRGRLILLLQSSFIATLSLPINPLLLLSPQFPFWQPWENLLT